MAQLSNKAPSDLGADPAIEDASKHFGEVVSDAFRSIQWRVEDRLRDFVAGQNGLAEVMQYALLTPGKRLRPLLVMLTAEDAGIKDDRALDLACAVEMVHCASLILDDLPCMDNASWRRDRPATHVKFGQDAAVLAAVALLSRAQEIVVICPSLETEIRCRAASILGRTAGAAGLSGGQYIDLRPGNGLDAAELEGVNEMKTGSLFVAAVQLGCVAAAAEKDYTDRMTRFARHLGQAFQILDDLADSGEIAEGRGDEGSRRKATLPSVLGRSKSHANLVEHLAACDAILNRAGKLRSFVDQIFAASVELRR